MTKPTILLDKVRYETFGGIVSSTTPPFLAWVDKGYMQKLGYTNCEQWGKEFSYLSAPTEVHFSITNSCSQRCTGCYMNSGSAMGEQLSIEKIKDIIKTLSEMEVFHIAFGGGEAFEFEDFSKIVTYCREMGMVPNLTTNGQHIAESEVAIAQNMGQVNVSIDGIGERYSINGRDGSFEKADQSLRRFKEAGISTGINCVVSKKNFHFIEELLEYATTLGISEIELLKYKPSGRGALEYSDFALTQDMIKSFYPLIISFSEKYSIEIKVDCSFVPAILYHNPPKSDLEKLGVVGCDAGSLLLSINSKGLFSGCSFVSGEEPVAELKKRWDTSTHLNSFRSLIEKIAEPCRSCEYLNLCRGGCRAVALHSSNDFFAPDPECPKVWDQTKNDIRPNKNTYIKLPYGILKIKKGYNPNSSSIGTVIYSLPTAYIIISALCALLLALVKPKKKGNHEAPFGNSNTTDK